MDHRTPGDRAVLNPTLDPPGMDEERERALETEVRLATYMRAFARVARATDHDIRSPLHTIVIYLELLRRTLAEGPQGEPAARQASYLEVVDSGIKDFEVMLLQFLRQARLGSEAPERMDLVETVHGILEFLEPYRRAARVEIAWEPSPDPLPVDAVKDFVRHALVHLLRTAIDAAREGEELRVQVTGRDGRAVLLVTAPQAWGASIRGMGQENGVEGLFGADRGLLVARRALQRDHATIEIRSGASRPTTLEIQMPLAAAEV